MVVGVLMPFVGEDERWLVTVLWGVLFEVLWGVIRTRSDHDELLVGRIEEIVAVVERRFHDKYLQKSEGEMEFKILKGIVLSIPICIRDLQIHNIHCHGKSSPLFSISRLHSF